MATPWDIDRRTGTTYGSTSTPSSRVTYYSKPRNSSGQLVGGQGSTPLSSYSSWSERWITPGARDEKGNLQSNTDPWLNVQKWRDEYLNGMRAPQMPTYYDPYGGGSGGGGGGYAGLTTEQQMAMANLRPSYMSYSAFVPPEMMARDTAVYDQARNRIGSARDADVAFAQDQGRQLMELLASQQNVMANPQMTSTPAMQQAYQRIVGGNPGNRRVADVINSENAYSQNSDNAFANLMAVLGAQEARNMQSRQREGMNDQAAILNAIRAQASGMLGGVDMADLQDARDYATRKDQRGFDVAYNNYLAQQGVNQGNVGISNDWAMNMLDLIPMLTDSGALNALLSAPGVGTVSTQAQRTA